MTFTAQASITDVAADVRHHLSTTRLVTTHPGVIVPSRLASSGGEGHDLFTENAGRTPFMEIERRSGDSAVNVRFTLIGQTSSSDLT
jgi:hypothetical protein